MIQEGEAYERKTEEKILKPGDVIHGQARVFTIKTIAYQ
jgi:hypothetical protein